MALYLVVHTPAGDDEGAARGPSRLLDLAREHGTEGAQPRWVRTWSPDLHDERIFSLWEALDAESILQILTAFGFLDHMAAKPLRVQEWGPEDILRAEGG